MKPGRTVGENQFLLSKPVSCDRKSTLKSLISVFVFKRALHYEYQMKILFHLLPVTLIIIMLLPVTSRSQRSGTDTSVRIERDVKTMIVVSASDINNLPKTKQQASS
jgi:hypothetical protein